jgi:hypothetical protein
LEDRGEARRGIEKVERQGEVEGIEDFSRWCQGRWGDFGEED